MIFWISAGSASPLAADGLGPSFIEALSNKEFWAAIKHGFKDASVDTLWSVSRKLLEGHAQKKINDLLNSGGD